MSLTRSIGFGEEESTTPIYSAMGKKHILGIGVDAYTHWRKLNNAVRDMEDITTLLMNRYDFTTSTLIKDQEATRDRIEEELYRYTDEHVLGPDDSLFIYYSGHGYLDKNKRGYWVPVGAQKDKIASYFPNSRIKEIVADMKCRHVLLVSDSCFSGSLFTRTRGGGEELVALDYERRMSRWAICSGREDQEVSDGSDGNSPFAKALIQELQLNNFGKINTSRIAEIVTTITRSNYNQLPAFGPLQDTGDMGGQFVFTLKDYKPGVNEVPVNTAQPTRGGAGTQPVTIVTTPVSTEPVTTTPITTPKQLKNAVLALIADGRTLDGIRLIIASDIPSIENERDAAILLSGRWKSLEREDQNGSIDSRDLTIGRNKINNALSSLVNNFS
ncbi:MAG: hypothetical protein RIR11_1039 [Bacteroidota bacterium]|jgi:hypothetical protein